MYILNLSSETLPTVQPWGDNYKHVPLNIRKGTITTQDGETKDHYLYDVVEKVNMPITVANIVKTAAVAKFGDSILEYVAANIYKTDDPKIIEYSAFCKKIGDFAKDGGYDE